ncbi:LutC/YkgG family protein [Albibacterium profundi]|uniref:LUD domain-containing protein n=1 Tax=Albibacterium profundi TaxID=3134906 RepID=A0ABV5CDB3_9SPHI
MKQSTSKEKILKKVRAALLQKRDNPYLNMEETSLYLPFTEPLEIEFAKQFSAVSGKFIFCEDELDLVENLILLADQFTLRKMYAWEPQLKKLLDQYDFPYYSTDTDFDKADAGITFCEALIARNGSILISNGTPMGRRLAIFPHIHIVIAYTSQLLPDIKDGLDFMKEKYNYKLPSMVNLITGPSRTADIEKTLVLGAHGPRELFVFLLDDSIATKHEA